MGYLNAKIDLLEQEIRLLRHRINFLESNTKDAQEVKPYSSAGGAKHPSLQFPVDIRTGLGGTYGNFLPWNDAELAQPPYKEGSVPSSPSKGYHKHTHSRFAGGALNVSFLEFVEYNEFPYDSTQSPYGWSSDSYNPHCQQFWVDDPPIATATDSDGEKVQKIGRLNLTFDPDTRLWSAGISEVTVNKTLFVKRDEDNAIELDDNDNSKASLIWSSNEQITDIVWDKVSRMWKFYAVFAEEAEEEEE